MTTTRSNGPTPDADTPFGLLCAVAEHHRHGDSLDGLLRILTDAGEGIGVVGAVAHVLRRNALVVAGANGLSDDDADVARVLPLVAPFPVTDCARLGIPVVLADSNQLTTQYPALSGFEAQALAVSPIDRAARTVGALSVVFDRPITDVDEMSTTLAIISRLCAPMAEFDHHEHRGTNFDTVVPPRPDNAATDRVAELERRLVRLEQMISFLAGTVTQHLDG